MDAIEQLKRDVREGRINLDRLIDVIGTLQRQLEAARQRIEELENSGRVRCLSDTSKFKLFGAMQVSRYRQAGIFVFHVRLRLSLY